SIPQASGSWEAMLRNSVIAAFQVKTSFGSKMKLLRRNSKITLRALAEQLGFARGYVSNIENGKTIPSFNAAMAISRILDPDGKGDLILLSMIERLPQEARNILLGKKLQENNSVFIKPEEPAEDEWEEEID
ncbi:MAG: helix-turn-helix transcriptional regulator, partial [Planctomycetota bacterium]